MEMIKKYAGILMMLTLLVGFTSCESEDETEFNLPGECIRMKRLISGHIPGEEVRL